MKYLESKIQKDIVQAVRYLFPKGLIFSVPNEAKRSVKMAGILKANGMMHGTSDLICINKGKVYFLEVKSEKGKQTDYQKEFEQKIKDQGLEYHVIRSVQDALKVLNQ